jgi:hypothetical protein
MQFHFLQLLTIASSVSATVLATTNIATVLAGVKDKSSLTIPAAAMTAMAKLGTGGATASTLTAADVTAIKLVMFLFLCESWDIARETVEDWDFERDVEQTQAGR